MITRNTRLARRPEIFTTDLSTSLERLKKARAVGCNPSDIGIDNQICKKLFSIRTSLFAKFL